MRGNVDLTTVLVTAQRLVLRQIASGSDFRETLRLIARSAEQVCPPMQASILYYDAEQGALRAGGSGKLPDEFVKAVDGLVPGPAMGSCGTAAFRKRRVITSSVANDPLWANFREFAESHKIRSAWSTPLLSRRNGMLLGVFGMYYPTEGSPSVSDLQIADHFSELATVALERVLHEEELKRLSRQDPLTGVLNRRTILQVMKQLIAETAQNGTAVSVAAVDIDHFQHFNQVLGHQAGDEILTALANRVSGLMPVGCHLGRLSGDRFILVAKAPVETMDELAHRVIATCRNPLPVEANGISVSVSIAIDTVGGAGGAGSVETLLEELAHSLKRRSVVGRNIVIPVTAADRTKVQDLQLLRTTLNEALVKKRFEPHFQPIFDLETGTCVGLEAMIRFPDAVGVPIHEALELAAASPMLGQIGFGMFERVCEIIRSRQSDIGDRFVSVNLSAAQLIQDDIAFRMSQIVARAMLAPHQFLLEIDDANLDPTAEPVFGNLRNLRDDGFRLALDGLENGNSSLRSLFCGHFEMVKMRSLQAVSAGKPNGSIESVRRSIFSTVRSLAASATVAVCGKNIETEQDLELAKSAGFRYGQGFYWAKPQPLEELLVWLNSRVVEKTEVC